ncbi:MAG: sulfatase-like hydrolase/transferase [Bryobacteraceae bacterium]|nr:sulfatase-like hydrolase/transferase [Bryobacteraceae bacterium]
MALCLSWANLCYLRVWSELLSYTEADLFTMVSEPARADYVAALGGMTVLGLAAWAAVRLARRLPSRLLPWLRWVPVVALLVPLNALRIVVSEQVPWLYGYLRQPVIGRISIEGLWLSAGLLAVAGLAVVWRFRRSAPRWPVVTALISLPLLPVTTGQALWRSAHSPTAVAASTQRPQVSGAHAEDRSGMRLVLVVFDEWDYRLSFEARPAGIELTELDRWRRESLFARRALPPASHTLTSVAALLTGMPVEQAQAIDRNDAVLTLAGGAGRVRWSETPSVFRDAVEDGARVGIAGWAVPYCRLYGAYASECAWWEMSTRRISKGSGYGQILASHLRSMVETALLSPFGQSAAAQHHYRTWRAMLAEATRLAADPTLRLVFVHLPVPHPPYVYDRARGRFDRANSLAEGYLDQLILVDYSVRELRVALEQANCWDRTAVLLTSDHSYRGAPVLGLPLDPRVPFLVRLPRGVTGLEYRGRFTTTVTRKLAGAILRGEVSDVHQTALWLDRHASQSGGWSGAD